MSNAYTDIVMPNRYLDFLDIGGTVFLFLLLIITALIPTFIILIPSLEIRLKKKAIFIVQIVFASILFISLIFMFREYISIRSDFKDSFFKVSFRFMPYLFFILVMGGKIYSAILSKDLVLNDFIISPNTSTSVNEKIELDDDNFFKEDLL